MDLPAALPLTKSMRLDGPTTWMLEGWMVLDASRVKQTLFVACSISALMEDTCVCIMVPGAPIGLKQSVAIEELDVVASDSAT